MVGPGLMSSAPGAPYAVVAGSVQSMARIAAQRAVDVLAFRLKDEWVSAAHVAISGGIVIDALLESLADSLAKHRVQWDRVHIWWTDERHLPQGSIGRFETRARAAGLGRIGIPPERIHPIPPAAHPGDEAPDRPARDYAKLLRKYAPHGRFAPMFDLVLLEVGEDASTAGLYRRDGSLTATDPVVPVWDGPPPARLRVTMSLPTVTGSARVWLFATGEDRAGAVRRALSCEPDAAAPPAARARGVLETLWWLDQHSATGMPGAASTTLLEEDDEYDEPMPTFGGVPLTRGCP